ncbi:MAG: glucose 1-dehydrogenase [Chloroflexota bacterium]
MGQLEGIVAIITGGGSGIGQAAARRFRAEGAKLAIVDINEAAATQTAAELQQDGGQAISIAADVSQLSGIERIVNETTKAFGRIDVLFNNAGINISQPFFELTFAEWDTQFGVNARGAFFLLQQVARQMSTQTPLANREVRGKIINTASLAAFRPVGETAAYSATKAVVVNFTRSAAHALATHKINVNAICPGYVKTPIYDTVGPQIEAANDWQPGEYFVRRSANIPWGRFGESEEMAGLSVFLAGPDSDYITGQAINFDGGVNMR